MLVNADYANTGLNGLYFGLAWLVRDYKDLMVYGEYKL